MLLQWLCALLALTYHPHRVVLRRARIRYALTEVTQVHHIIPHELLYHPVCADLQIDAGPNVMLLPNDLGKRLIETERPVHQGGHVRYNVYTKARLDFVYHAECAAMYPLKLRELQADLRRLIRTADVPWN